MISELFKNKGSPSILKNYRDVMLADFSGKGATKLIRAQILPYVNKLVGNYQYGSGLNGGETAFPLYLCQIGTRLVPCK